MIKYPFMFMFKQLFLFFVTIRYCTHAFQTTTYPRILFHNSNSRSIATSFVHTNNNRKCKKILHSTPDDDLEFINEEIGPNGEEFLYAPTSEKDMYTSEALEAQRANEMIATTILAEGNIDNKNTKIELQDEVSNSFLQYALSIILGRAIPDVRDGLKPVHRRILYAMDQLRLYPNKSHRKCARVVGEVLGKYHPHGDVAVYDSLVRMAQEFSSNHPLVDGHGNFGSIDADPAAAMRYTECRLTSLAQQALLGDEYDSSTSSTDSIIDFIPNFDGNEIEPTILPAKVPMLLLNGASGIAVGMATNIPPHNLNELLEACIEIITNMKENLDVSDDRLFEIIPGPDFPTGASIMGTSGAKQLYKAGHGGIMMRAITHVENVTNNSKKNVNSSSTGRNAIIVTELPYQVNKAALLQKIAALVNDKKLEGISDLRDESDRDGIRIVIELKRDAVAAVVLNNLYQKTALQTSFSGNFLALIPKDDDTADDTGDNITSITTSDRYSDSVVVPQRFTLRRGLDCFLKFRFNTIRRKSKYQLTKVQNRIHIVDGLLLALVDVDVVISIIRKATDQSEARILLQEKLGTSAIQTDSIFKLQLGQLTRLNNDKLRTERNELETKANELNQLLQIDSTVYDYMIQEFTEMKHKFGRPRKTRINTIDDSEVDDINLIRNSRSIIVLTRGGYIKRLPLKTFESQGRGTRGKRGTTASSTSSSATESISSLSSTQHQQQSTKANDEEIAHCFSCNDHDTLLMVTQTGISYGIRAYQVPIAGRTARGQPIPSVLPAMTPTDAITTILPVSKFGVNDYLLLTTEHGWIKKTPLAAFENMSSRGLLVAKLDDNDRLRWCQQVRDGDDILIGTAKGMATRFQASDLRPTSRSSRGVNAIKLKRGDTIADVNVLTTTPSNVTSTTSASSSMSTSDENHRIDQFALVVTVNGFGKRILLNEFRTTSRGGVGVIATKFKKHNTSHLDKNNNNDNVEEKVCCLLAVDTNDEILVTTAKGIMLRQRVSDIPTQGRTATGVTIQKLDDGDHIIRVGIVPTYEESDPQSQ